MAGTGFSNAGKGAATGAAVGSLFGPGVGTAVGAAVGGGLGLLSGIAGGGSQNAAHDSIGDAIDILDESKGYIDSAKSANADLVGRAFSTANDLWNPDGTLSQKYQDALSGIENLNGYDASLFDYDKSIQDFYDPAFQLSVNMANDAINNSQATGGNMFSSDTANKLAAKNNVLATQMYNDARDALNQDKSLEQSIWAGNESAKQAEANSATQIANAKLGAYGTGMSNLSDAEQAYFQGMQDINSNYASDMADYLGTKASLKASDPGKNQWWDVFDLF